MRYYIIAGEASGDLHASNLIKELKQRDPGALIRAWGGDLMEKAGAVLVKHYRDLAFMGFLEVILHLRTIKRNLRFCKTDLLEFQPDVLILVDYPGFNLRMAKYAAEQGIRVFYYISPQLWAWRASRVKIVRNYVEHMFVILPFEKEFYNRYHYPVDFVGHPLLDVIQETLPASEPDTFKRDLGLSQKPVVALLPGSRKMEIRKMLKVMLSAAPSFPGYQFVVAAAPSIPDQVYESIIGTTGVRVVRDHTYDLLARSAAALVTSGTATLETALLGVPQVVCYRANSLSYLIARQVVQVKFISLVNLIADRQVVTELIQRHLTRENIILELRRILEQGDTRDEIRAGYTSLRSQLGGPGASGRAAGLMVQYLSKK
jgi:lipid-A-disaccharide synthase